MQNPAIFHSTTIRKGGTAQVPSPQGETSHIQSQHSLDCTDVPLLNSWHKNLLSVAKAATSFLAGCLLPPQYTLTVAESPTQPAPCGVHTPHREAAIAPEGTQARCEQLKACFPEAGWQVMPVTHDGGALPPLQLKKERSSSCWGLSRSEDQMGKVPSQHWRSSGPWGHYPSMQVLSAPLPPPVPSSHHTSLHTDHPALTARRTSLWE